MTTRSQTQNPTRTQFRLPAPDEAERLSQDNVRLQSERASWANQASAARLERDELQSRFKNQRLEMDFLKSQNKAMKEVVLEADALLRSRLWAESSLAGSRSQPIGRLRVALNGCRDLVVKGGRIAVT